MEKNVQNSVPEYKVIFQNQSKITEDVPKNSLQELCQYIMLRGKQLGDPQKVVFPNGKEYLWGEAGAYAAHQFAAKGRISENDFIQMLTEHSNNKLNLAKINLDVLRETYLGWQMEYKMAEQKLQETLNCMSTAFEEYSSARKAILELNEQSHGTKD